MTLRQPGQVEQWLLRLLIFLVPANLAYHFSNYSIYIRGRLVDYLTPQVFLSDLVVWMLIVIFVLKTIHSRGIKQLFRILRNNWLFLLTFLYLLIISITSPLPTAAVWYWSKLVQFSLLALYLVNSYSRERFLHLVFIPIILTVCFQFFLALYQFITQSSLFGYLFLGEANLAANQTVSGVFFQQIRLLPYATTPHPNVLAGTLTVYTLIIFLYYKYNPNLALKNIIKIIITSLTIIVIMLTQSLSALLGLIMGVSLVPLTSKTSKKVKVSQVVFITLLLALIFTLSIYQLNPFSDLYSIVRRYMLFSTSFSLLQTHSITGTGPNQFIPAANQASLVTDASIFLQPVHNIFFLWLTETGIIGFLLVSWAIYLIFRSKPNQQRSLINTPPLLALLIIGLVDHYPLTLQTGLLLLSLSSFLYLAQPENA